MSTVPTNAELLDVLTTALESGYAEEFEVVAHTRDPESLAITSATVAMSEGYEDDDRDEDWRFTFTPHTLRTGADRFAAWVRDNDPAHRTYLGEQYAEAIDPDCEWGYLDAIGSDALLQFAAFGDVIYS
jgi:hypothetical protein